MHGINESESADAVGEANDFADGIYGSDGVRGVTDGNEFRARRNLAPKVVHIQRAIFFADVHLANDYAAIFEGAPRRDVGIVIESGDDNLIARLQIAADATRERKGERGHVGPKENFGGIAIEKISHGFAGAGDHCIGAATGGKCAAGIGIGIFEIVAESLDYLLWNLRSRCRVEKCGRMAVYFLL